MIDDEVNRPVPGFCGIIRRGEETFIVSYALQDVYDVAMNSMDFGSGFLTTEEVQHLYELGKAIGAEPFHYHYSKTRCPSCGGTDSKTWRMND